MTGQAVGRRHGHGGPVTAAPGEQVDEQQGAVRYDVVVPTVGRPSLEALIASLALGDGPLPETVLCVDDRPGAHEPLDVAVPPALAGRVKVLRGPGRGPAAARNVGWRASRAEWVAFLDDDVVLPAGWRDRLADDLAHLPPQVAGAQGRIDVPLSSDRPATDWERNVAGLETARWATADLAYRRIALADVGGFDERFPRAYREDADLGLRLVGRGWEIRRGDRRITHPVRPSDRWVSVRLQAGNADDVLMAALHGPGWRERAGVPRGRRRRHLAVAAIGAGAVITALSGRRRGAAGLAAGWLAGTAELAWARIAPGPRTAEEITTMLLTSAVMPFAAAAHWLRGCARVVGGAARPRHVRPAAVLFDRDGTLVDDVPYNGDPAKVRLRPGVPEALRRLREAGVPTAVISNQSGVARGLLTHEQVEAVNRRVEELVGPLGPWLYCPHGPDDGCGCRKPEAGLVEQAAAALGVEPERCAVVGDIGSDVEAALAAGAAAVLVPTDVTLPEEIAAAPLVAPDLASAVDLLLDGGWRR
jgi:histidinol-phosphate phosphatase family protein